MNGSTMAARDIDSVHHSLIGYVWPILMSVLAIRLKASTVSDTDMYLPTMAGKARSTARIACLSRRRA